MIAQAPIYLESQLKKHAAEEISPNCLLPSRDVMR